MSKDKILYKDWEAYRLNLIKETSTVFEDEATRLKRIENLSKKGNHEEFFKYYFPNYYKSEPANFHKKASTRFINNSRIYEVRPWARGLSKSARAMFEVLYLSLTGQIRNVILISATQDAAENLLKPWKINLESNQRIISDFGEQSSYNWTGTSFITKQGVSFFGFGAGQSPRGNRNEEIRPDVIIFDDIDTDEEVRSTDRINKKWDWIEQAVLPTTDISGNIRILFNGNIIGKDTCITRAMKHADYCEIINIRDKNSKSTWLEKNSEEQIDWLLSKMSYRSAQKEYFNNPISEGTVFKQLQFGKIPDLKKFPYLIAYGDPALSNKKRNIANKAVWLVGYLDNNYYIIKGFLDSCINQKFIDWFFLIDEYVNDATIVYNYIENNSLQDPFYQQVFLPLFLTACQDKSRIINIRPDARTKPDKFARIEGNLEPLNTQGRLIINEKEKENPHVKRLVDQFMLLSEQMNAPADGPDTIEGAVWLINNKHKTARKIVTKTNVVKNKRRF